VLDSLLKSQQADTITITFRGIGEMIGDKKASSSDMSTSWMDLSPFESDEFDMRRAFVNLVATPRDQQLWNIMDQATIQLAQAMAGSPCRMRTQSPSIQERISCISPFGVAR